MKKKLLILRLFDMHDGWIDASKPVSEKEVTRLFNKATNNGYRRTKFEDGDYYKVFPARSNMLMTPEFLGR